MVSNTRSDAFLSGTGNKLKMMFVKNLFILGLTRFQIFNLTSGYFLHAEFEGQASIA